MQQPVVVLVATASAVLIACLSLARGDARLIAAVPSWMAPIGHVVLYGLLAFACTRCLQGLAITTHVAALAAALLATGFGAAMEFAQRWRPGRFARASDVLVDAIGATLGAMLAVT